MKLYLFLAVLCFGNSCKKAPFIDYFYTIRFMNESRDTVVPFLAFGGYGYREGVATYPLPPDTSLPEIRPALPIVPPERSYSFNNDQKWSSVFKESGRDTIYLFIIDDSTYENIDWSTIRTDHLYIDRIAITAQDFENDEYLTINYK